MCCERRRLPLIVVWIKMQSMCSVLTLIPSLNYLRDRAPRRTKARSSGPRPPVCVCSMCWARLLKQLNWYSLNGSDSLGVPDECRITRLYLTTWLRRSSSAVVADGLERSLSLDAALPADWPELRYFCLFVCFFATLFAWNKQLVELRMKSAHSALDNSESAPPTNILPKMLIMLTFLCVYSAAVWHFQTIIKSMDVRQMKNVHLFIISVKN